MRSSKNIDMTQGPIMKLVVLFALPICLGNILQQLYNTIDTLIIGNFCGPISLAAVGTSGQPVEFLLCIFLGLGTGVSILVSQNVGLGDTDSIRRTVATATTFLYACAIPLSVLGMFLGPLLLRIMQCPADTWDPAVSYIRIVFLGTLGNMGYNMNAGVLRGIGDSRASLLFLVISCVVNVVLDLLFVAVFKLDVAGAALATAIAMFASWIFSIAYIRKRYPELEFSIFPKALDRRILTRIIAVGLPLGLNNSIYSIGHILLQSLINAQGAIFMAGCSVATKLTGLANVAISSFASAATTFAGQNLGAKQYLRLQRGARMIPLCSGMVTGIAGVIMAVFCPPLLSLFNRDPQVLEVAVTYVRIVLPFTWPFAVFSAMVHFVNGIGEVRFPTIVNILMLWVVRIPSAYLVARFISGRYLMVCFPISFIFAMCAMSTFFLSRKWKNIRQLARQEEQGARAGTGPR